jgi:diaminopimelate decarboxylase
MTLPALAPTFADRVTAWAAERVAATPAYGFAPRLLRMGVDWLREALGARISYSTKANPHPLVLRELAARVDEFNVTSLRHLDDLIELGVEPARIAWLHPAVTPKTLEAVLRRGVRRFVVDDRRGLDLLSSTGADVALTLRLLPPDPGESERSVVRFGNTADVLLELAGAAVAAGLDVEALSFFVGTDGEGLGEARPFRSGIEALAALHAELREDGIPVRTINIGGGFPGSRRRFYLEHPGFFNRIGDALHAAFGGRVDVLCEPGRFLAEPCLVMLTRVVADRVVAGRRLVSVDASSYGGLFETSFVDHGGEGLTIGTRTDAGTSAPGELLGPIMDSFDVIRKGGELPPLREGELLVLPNVGAYSVGFSSDVEGIRAPEVVVLPDELAAALAEEWYE